MTWDLSVTDALLAGGVLPGHVDQYRDAFQRGAVFLVALAGPGLAVLTVEDGALVVLELVGRDCLSRARAVVEGLAVTLGLGRVRFETVRPSMARVALGWGYLTADGVTFTRSVSNG